ncbi:MAG: class I SAM-dependent methyltransferase [Bacteroidia bacterium]|nr:class I SAM-dependent methyltransferase [Bacteroidia bacterium]
MDNYLDLNKKAWNRKTELHFDSKFYDVDGFRAGKNILPDIDLALLKDVKGKSLLHLQCHFGMDTMAIQRLGAQCTGIDLSDTAIDRANKLNAELELSCKFVCCDVYHVNDHIKEEFDIVYTSYGTIGWLPDLDKWATIVASRLKPGGKFIFSEFHPVVWMFDYEFEKVAYNYFKDQAIIEEETGTYSNPNHPESFTTASWNHSISEVLTALLNVGLKIEEFKEYDYSPYDCFKGTKKLEEMKYVIEKHEGKLPMVYSIVATK